MLTTCELTQQELEALIRASSGDRVLCCEFGPGVVRLKENAPAWSVEALQALRDEAAAKKAFVAHT